MIAHHHGTNCFRRYIVVALINLLLVASSSSSSASHWREEETTDNKNEDTELQNLLRRAHEISQDKNNHNAAAEHRLLWKRVRKLKPRWAEANARYGMILLETGGSGDQSQKNAIELLRRSIDIQHVEDPIPLNSPGGIVIASTVGRYYHSVDQTIRAIPIIDNVYNANPNDLCLALMSSTMILHQVPSSITKEDEIVSEYLLRNNNVLKRLLQQQQQQQQSSSQTTQQQSREEIWTLDQQYLSQTFPGAASDPYEHCMISESLVYVKFGVLQHVCVCVCVKYIVGCECSFFVFIIFISTDIFYLSFYYRANVTLVASRYYQLAINVWPDLNYISKRALLQYQQQQQQDGIIPPPTNSKVITNGDDNNDLSERITRLETIVVNQTKEIQTLRPALRNAGIQIDENDDNNNIALHSSSVNEKEIVKRKIRLGIVSPNLTKKHSVVEDFKGTMA